MFHSFTMIVKLANEYDSKDKYKYNYISKYKYIKQNRQIYNEYTCKKYIKILVHVYFDCVAAYTL